jgi:hypothetical protein
MEEKIIGMEGKKGMRERRGRKGRKRPAQSGLLTVIPSLHPLSRPIGTIVGALVLGKRE